MFLNLDLTVSTILNWVTDQGGFGNAFVMQTVVFVTQRTSIYSIVVQIPVFVNNEQTTTCLVPFTSNLLQSSVFRNVRRTVIAATFVVASWFTWTFGDSTFIYPNAFPQPSFTSVFYSTQSIIYSAPLTLDSVILPCTISFNNKGTRTIH